MERISTNKLIKRLSNSSKPVKISVGGRRNTVQVNPGELPKLVLELRKTGKLAWAPYCEDCHGFVVEADFLLLRANTDLFVFYKPEIGVPQELLLRLNTELLRGYRSKNGYIAVTGDQEAVAAAYKIVEFLQDNDVVLLVHKPTDPCIRVA